MLRILAGEYRGRRLLSPPDGRQTRPYLARVRESVCGMLHEWFAGASVLDLFSGVGTVGLEALSRGADRVVMVERSRRIFSLMQQNVEALGCRDRVVTVNGDALGSACLLRCRRPVQLVFVDPPYTMVQEEAGRLRVMNQIGRCRSLMEDQGFVVLRCPIGPEDADLAVPGFQGPEPHRYRKEMWIHLYAPE